MSNTAEFSVGGNLEVVRVIEHTRNKDIWDHYDLCEMSNGSRRARCKLCLKFLASEGNTTLKNYLTKSCKALRSRSDPSQSNLTPQGGVFVYDNEKLREAFTKFVITKALPFDHFDDEDFTTTIQQLMQPRYTQEAQFPILAAMARDLLTVQASTVASESAFSVSGRVISQRRSRLSPESVEVCICLKDYLDGAARKQHITTLEDAIDADLEANLHIEEVELGISPPNEEGEDDKEEMAMGESVPLWGNRFPPSILEISEPNHSVRNRSDKNRSGSYTIVNLRLVPWGNADIVGDLIRCQHGEDECDLNAIHSCVIHLWPDEKTRFGFVRCTEEQRLKEVPVSSEEAMLPAYLSIIPLVFSPKSSILRSTLDIECLHLLLQHGNETESLNPPYEYAPWVVVNKQPLKTDYEKFVKYVCDAYQGDPKPEACNAQSCSVGSTNRKMATKIHSGCYAEQS
ncbi:putative Gamma-interferon-inducible lysosomal thiol reductase precursor [Hibiscus syriacus]|uniref:Gamma-interferon-inducible lysosomal thiol reductase n=1 Tax=Hibiscus syriacus TaxID=106335 RepID=A0A6A2ZWY3_HIBSY|nr:putative Gamma-interferon-inducible lysosomal thiol reductase precursor [Hibiscus syriacus]